PHRNPALTPVPHGPHLPSGGAARSFFGGPIGGRESTVTRIRCEITHFRELRSLIGCGTSLFPATWSTDRCFLLRAKKLPDACWAGDPVLP
ncbi:hypothetical protein ACWEF9_38765, partial [Streptomyces sp. NPDC004980]